MTTGFMVVNRDYRKPQVAALKVAIPGERIEELDRRAGRWSEGERLEAGHRLKVELAPGDGRLFRVVGRE